MDDYKGQCFVMQPFDRARYDSLYEQVFDPAIRNARLKPHRVDNDPGASIPVETIEEEITKSVACFGEISEDNPNVWFELGYAIAREKPLPSMRGHAAKVSFRYSASEDHHISQTAIAEGL